MTTGRTAVLAAIAALLLAGTDIAAQVVETRLTDSNGVSGDLFGSGAPGVAIDGDVAVVGSYFANVGVTPGQGSAAVFRWNGSGWVEEQELFSSIGASTDLFGISVAVDGDVAVVGAPFQDVTNSLDQGIATVFRWNGATWVEKQLLTFTTNHPGARCGSSVAIDGDVIVVGANDDDVGGAAAQGSALAYRWNGTSSH